MFFSNLLGQPTDVYVNPDTNEAFITDGYTNRRVLVVDANTGEYKRLWGAYGNQPDDSQAQTMAFRRQADGPQPQQFNTPHCVAGANDGLLYVCDRGTQRIQIFQQDGTFVSDLFVKTADDAGPGEAPQDMEFSRDPDQRVLFVIGGGRCTRSTARRWRSPCCLAVGDARRASFCRHTAAHSTPKATCTSRRPRPAAASRSLCGSERAAER